MCYSFYMLKWLHYHCNKQTFFDIGLSTISGRLNTNKNSIPIKMGLFHFIKSGLSIRPSYIISCWILIWLMLLDHKRQDRALAMALPKPIKENENASLEMMPDFDNVRKIRVWLTLDEDWIWSQIKLIFDNCKPGFNGLLQFNPSNDQLQPFGIKAGSYILSVDGNDLRTKKWRKGKLSLDSFFKELKEKHALTFDFIRFKIMDEQEMNFRKHFDKIESMVTIIIFCCANRNPINIIISTFMSDSH